MRHTLSFWGRVAAGKEKVTERGTERGRDEEVMALGMLMGAAESSVLRERPGGGNGEPTGNGTGNDAGRWRGRPALTRLWR